VDSGEEVVSEKAVCEEGRLEMASGEEVACEEVVCEEGRLEILRWTVVRKW